MREILVELFKVTDDELDCVLEFVQGQLEGKWFTPPVRKTLDAVLNLWTVDRMMEEFAISRDVAHGRRSRLGYDVLRQLLEQGAITVNLDGSERVVRDS